MRMDLGPVCMLTQYIPAGADLSPGLPGPVPDFVINFFVTFILSTHFTLQCILTVRGRLIYILVYTYVLMVPLSSLTSTNAHKFAKNLIQNNAYSI